MTTPDDTGKDATFTALRASRNMEMIANPSSWPWYPYLPLVRSGSPRERHTVGMLQYVSFDQYKWFPGLNMFTMSPVGLRHPSVQPLLLDTVGAQALLAEDWYVD